MREVEDFELYKIFFFLIKIFNFFVYEKKKKLK